MNESISALLLLLVFVGLSFLRTAIENRASHEQSKSGIEKIRSVFFLTTGAILVCAFILVTAGNLYPSAGELCSYGLSLLIAVTLSLIAGGEPQIHEEHILFSRKTQ